MSVSENPFFLPRAPSLMRVVRLVFATTCAFYLTNMMAVSSAAPAVIETRFFRFTFAGGGEILDKRAGVTWRSESESARFGEVTLHVAGRPQRCELTQAEVQSVRNHLVASFHPLNTQPTATLRVMIRALPDTGNAEVRIGGVTRIVPREAVFGQSIH
jgi:hypothetical protein